MKLSEDFDHCFQSEYLKEYYKKYIQYGAQPGIDRVTYLNFNKYIETYIDTISRKVLNSTYNYTPYKEFLILKGRNQSPRQISMPSIKDKIVLSIVKDLLNKYFQDIIKSEFIKKKIRNVHGEFSSDKYDCFIKIDMKDFYGSLNHKYLMNKLSTQISNKRLLYLIEKAIKKQTISPYENQNHVDISKIGVPQGLPISNILSDIYMIVFDNKHYKSEDYSYFRYVDDILVLCNSKTTNVQQLLDELSEELKENLYLTPHEEETYSDKTCRGNLDKGFSYLGYEFNCNNITVKKSSKFKIERSIEKLFTDYRNSTMNFEAFLWKLNLRVTGGIFNRNQYGWLFYYSQINDETLMFQLDHLIKKLFIRFEISKKLKSNSDLKKFTRTYHEIKKNIQQTSYIPNFDNLTTIEKISILTKCKVQVNNKSKDSVDIAFKSFIKKNLKELEQDINNIS